MILKLPENRKKIINYLEKVDEDTFINEFIIPFFGSQGYQVYRSNSHGPGEHGKDIIFCRYVPLFFENEFVIVQAKAEKVTTSNVTKMSDQLKRALNTKFASRSGSGDLTPHYAIFINARKHTNDAYTEFPQLVSSPHAKILSQENACELIIQSGIAPKHLLSQLSTSTTDTRSKEDKAVFKIILGNDPSEIDNLLDHKLKFIKEYLNDNTKKLILEYIFDRWEMDRSWVGTVKPMKWFDMYFDFFTENQSHMFLDIFKELNSSNPSFDAMPYTQSVIRKITPELLAPIQKKFTLYCAEQIIYSPKRQISKLIAKLQALYEAKLIKSAETKKLARKILQAQKYKKEGNNKKQQKIKDEIDFMIYPEDVDFT